MVSGDMLFFHCRLLRWTCALMQMNLEYLAIDTQVFPYGTCSGSINYLVVSFSLWRAFLVSHIPYHGRSAGVVDRGRWQVALVHAALTLVEGVHLRKLMPERCFLLQGFTTDNDVALEQLFGEHNEGTRDYDACIETIATRLSTVFASLKVLAD